MQGVYHVRKKFKREYIMSGGNLSGVYHFIQWLLRSNHGINIYNAVN